jgi:hypothetical protein
MSILSTLNSLRDSLVPLADNWDQIHNRSLFVVDRLNSTYFRITPNPSIRSASSQLIAFMQSRNIRVERDTKQVQGISKSYTREDLTGRGKYYVIEGEEVNGAIVGGKKYDRYPDLDLEETPAGWNIVLKEREGEA